jgi:hypothetical protein
MARTSKPSAARRGVKASGQSCKSCPALADFGWDQLPGAPRLIGPRLAGDLQSLRGLSLHVRKTLGPFGVPDLSDCVAGKEIRDCLPPLVFPFHSITSSARASSLGGISRPRVFAVFRLMTNSNAVACSTGRSPGLVAAQNSSNVSTGFTKHLVVP